MRNAKNKNKSQAHGKEGRYTLEHECGLLSERVAVSDTAISLMKIDIYGVSPLWSVSDSSCSFSVCPFVCHSLQYVSIHCLLVFPLLPSSVRMSPQLYKCLL